MKDRLRAGVIGAGSWAVHAHIPALAARPEVELVSICRRNSDVLESLRTRFGFEFASEDYREAIDQDLDIVVVASPTAMHFEHVALALESGAHVLCEKPMAIRPFEAWQLVEMADHLERQLLLSFGWNFMPIFRRARDLVAEQGIGQLEHVTVHMSSPTRELLSNTGTYPDADPETVPQQATWTDSALSGGGYGQAQLSHALAMLFGLFSVRVVEAKALLASALNAPVETHAVFVARFDNGAIGAISGGSNHVGASDNKHELEVRAIGSEGQLILDVHRELVWLYRHDGTDTQLALAPGSGTYDPYGPAHALVDVALGDHSQNSAPGELGARTVEALGFMYESVSTAISPNRSGDRP